MVNQYQDERSQPIFSLIDTGRVMKMPFNGLKLVDYATSHIAGYSKDGKAKGTRMSVRAISRFFDLGIDQWEPAGVEPPSNPVIQLDGSEKPEEQVLSEAILSTYQIESDDKALRENPHLFEQLRGDYPVRREFDSYSIRARNVEADVIEKLRKLGFECNSLNPV